MVFVNGARGCNLALRFRELYSSNGYSGLVEKQDEKNAISNRRNVPRPIEKIEKL